MNLTPDPASLGLASPLLGPWFNESVTLGTPDPSDLSVQLSVPLTWLPPATGTLTLIVPQSYAHDGETLYHRQLVHLRNAKGEQLFVQDAPNTLVALFTLLPEVYVRLEQLYGRVAKLGAVTPDGLRLLRPVPRQWALEIAAPPSQQALFNLVDITEADPAMLGLKWEENKFANLPRPMAWLRRPKSPPEILLKGVAAAKLYVFDKDGMPIDPGAVVKAFAHLRSQFGNLGIGDLPQIAEDAQKQLIHFVGATGGAVQPELLAGISGATGDTILRMASSDKLAFTESVKTNYPFARMALLPGGSYATEVPVDQGQLFERDCLRVGVVDLELLLTGRSRNDTTTLPIHQTRASTRVELARTTTDNPLLPNHDAVLGKVNELLRGDQPVTIISSQIAGQTGLVPAPAPLPDAVPPDGVTLTLLSLQGGRGPTKDEKPSDWDEAMQVVVNVTLAKELANAWVRVMPLKFDVETGERVRMVGGAGRAVVNSVTDENATAFLLVTLPPGNYPSDPSNEPPLVLDVEVVTGKGKRLFGSRTVQRIERISGEPQRLALTEQGKLPDNPIGYDRIYICETGVELHVQDDPVPSLPSGLTLLAKKDSTDIFALLDTSPASYTRFTDSLGIRLRTGVTLVTTDRVWNAQPSGDHAKRLEPTGASIVHTQRNGLNQLTGPGAPLPTLERAELVATAIGDDRAEAVLGALPLVNVYHELHPPQPGWAGVPAQSVIHSTGVHLSGPAALLAHEIVRDRRFADTPTLLSEAAKQPPSSPTDPTGSGPVVALLRTVAAGVEGESVLHLTGAITPASFLEGYYNFTPQAVVDWLKARLPVPNLPELPPEATEVANRVKRAADRRVMGAVEGFSETAATLVNLIRNAQRFIYIETPAFDAGIADVKANGEFDRLTDDVRNKAINLLSIVRQQLIDNPQLHLLICLPYTFEHPWAGMRHLRSQFRQAALDSLYGDNGESPAPWSPSCAQRVAVFSPLAADGLTLPIASSTVIVDDLVAVTGSFALTRRGLTFDSSVAAAVFDERLVRGCGRTIFEYRQQLVSARLGETPERIPHDGAQLTRLVYEMVRTQANPRISHPAPPRRNRPTGLNVSLDPDGRPGAGVDVLNYLTKLLVAPDELAPSNLG